MIDYTTYKCGSDEDILVLELKGRLDAVTSVFLSDSLAGYIDDGISKIVLDCGELDHINSIGLEALVRVHSRLKKSGGAVKLAQVGGVVADVLRIVHFDRLFHIHPTVEEACQALDGET